MDEHAFDEGWCTVACTFQPLRGVSTDQLLRTVRAVVESFVGRQPGSTCYVDDRRVLPPARS